MFNNLKNEPFINDGVTFMVPWFKKCHIFFSFNGNFKNTRFVP